jgi:hypothetical protein
VGDGAAKSGRIPSVRLGGPSGPVRFVPEEIERWLENERRAWLPGSSSRQATAGVRSESPQLLIDGLSEH